MTRPDRAVPRRPGSDGERTPTELETSGKTPQTCDLCGGPMIDRHCKLTCAICGYQRDCSDP